MTTKDDIREWFERGKAQGAGHLLVVCDTFSHEDYPVFCMPEESLPDKANQYHGPNMQRVMECYDLNKDMENQLAERRAFHGWSPV